MLLTSKYVIDTSDLSALLYGIAADYFGDADFEYMPEGVMDCVVGSMVHTALVCRSNNVPVVLAGSPEFIGDLLLYSHSDEHPEILHGMWCARYMQYASAVVRARGVIDRLEALTSGLAGIRLKVYNLSSTVEHIYTVEYIRS